MKKNFTLLLFVFISICAVSQDIQKPNFAIASHPMVIEQIIYDEGYLIIEISIENKTANGNFCADPHIYLRDLINHNKFELDYSEGIPVCPDFYQFKWIGEKLRFSLFFPNPGYELKYLDLIEDCDEACFSILGIILNIEMNKKIESAFQLFDEGDYEASENTFRSLINESTDYPYGFLHFNLIQVLIVEEKLEEARQYYQIISDSNFADKAYILDQLSKTKLFDN